jgi:hypothetical protein
MEVNGGIVTLEQYVQMAFAEAAVERFRSQQPARDAGGSNN